MKVWKILWIAAAVFLLLPACRKDSPAAQPDEEEALPEADTTFVLSESWVDISEFRYIHPGFSVSADSGAPWGFAHLGLDLILAGDSAHVIAPSGGTVEFADIYQNEHNLQWQVNLRVRFDGEFIYHMLFEPRAHTREEAEFQRAAMPLTVGQRVKRGDFLGMIYDLSGGDMSSGGATVHFDIWKGDQNICPAPYMTSEAYEGMLFLIRSMYPDADLCYP
ncbi:hypothetical protein JW948_06555 [bacterium]|nr:hypothetical protein [bacterium]